MTSRVSKAFAAPLYGLWLCASSSAIAFGVEPHQGPIGASSSGPSTRPLDARPEPAPFAEPVLPLFTFDGEAPGEQFGWVARAVGDCDGDGVIDFAASAPFHAGSAGRVAVHSGRTGERLASLLGEPGDLLGWVVGPAGDLDGDGCADVAVGAPWVDPPAAAGAGTKDAPAAAPPRTGPPGRVIVIGGADGQVLRELRGDVRGARFGEDVAPAPDLDGDGVSDLIVGAPRELVDGVDCGAVHVMSGATGARILRITGEREARFGASVACTTNARVLAVTALEGGATRHGEVRLFGLPGLAPRAVVPSGVGLPRSAAADADEQAPDGTGHLGWFLGLVPDVDGDGVHEVYATDWQHANTRGRAVLLSGASGAPLTSIEGERAGLGFGIGVAGRDDFDGDGVNDFVVGAWLDRTHGQQCGRVDIRSGKDGALLGRLTGRVPGAVLGFDADSLGDVDADGVPDVLVTAAYHSPKGATPGSKTGRVYVVSGAKILAAFQSLGDVSR